MKIKLFCVFFLLSIQLFAQEENKIFDIRFGVGRTLLGAWGHDYYNI